MKLLSKRDVIDCFEQFSFVTQEALGHGWFYHQDELTLRDERLRLSTATPESSPSTVSRQFSRPRFRPLKVYWLDSLP